MFTYFREINLMSENQSGFKPGDSCVNQLLAITREIFSSFDNNDNVRGYSLTFQKLLINHIHKFKHNKISGNLSPF